MSIANKFSVAALCFAIATGFALAQFTGQAVGDGIVNGGGSSITPGTTTCVNCTANQLLTNNGTSITTAPNLTSSLGYLQWLGEARTTSATTLTTTIPQPLLSVQVNNGKTYKFDVHIPIQVVAATDGIAARITGTLGASAIVYDGWVVDSGQNGIKGNTQASALNTNVANTILTGTAGHVEIYGTVTVNSTGTLAVQVAQSTTGTNASATTISQGATLIVTDIP